MNDSINQDTIKALGLEDWNQDELSLFAERTGALAVESAIARLLAELDESGIEALENYIHTSGDEADVLTYLSNNYSQFSDFLSEELTFIRNETRQVMGA